MQLWLTPHGVVKAALANKATRAGAHGPVRRAQRGYTATAFIDDRGLVERVEAMVAHPVTGDLRVQMSYTDYQDFGGVKFPTRIRQWAGGFPTLDLTISEVRPNAAADIEAPVTVRSTTWASTRAWPPRWSADGVWYITGGTHHSVAIEMSDHVDRGGGPAQRRARAGRDRGGAQPRARQADPVRRQHPPPLRPLGGAARLRGRGRDHHHPRASAPSSSAR